MKGKQGINMVKVLGGRSRNGEKEKEGAGNKVKPNLSCIS